MPIIRSFFLPALLVASSGLPLAAQQSPPSYTKDIKPFLAKYCLECQQEAKGKGGLDVSTYQTFRKGGISFPGFVPGKPDDSFAVILVEGKSKPLMPPSKAKQPTAAEKGLLRAWIAAGAQDDSSAGATTTLPKIQPRVLPQPSVAALAYRSDGKLLAVGRYREVLLLHPATQEVMGKLGDLPAGITALAFTRDGQRLAVASGTTGMAGMVHLYALAGEQIPTKPERILTAHADSIYDLAFTPDGTTLATTGYDRLIKLWDVASGQELGTLKDHSDAVYGLAFSPDGKLLASASADRAVKVWQVATGTRLYTLSDATDWVYAVAWSPNGKHLAAAGVDRSIRVWEVSTAGGKLIHSAFAHEGPVLRLAYAADNSTLYSLSEDRSVKAWDADKLVEKKVYAKQPETVLALAVSPDHRQLALGRYDGALVLLDEATGKVQAQPLPVKSKQPGDRFQPVDKQPGNDTPAAAQPIRLPVTIAGAIAKAGAVDFYRFEAQTGQQVGVQAIPADAKAFDPVLELTDLEGKTLAEGPNGLLGWTCEKAGTYRLSIRDRDFRGGGLGYRLNVGAVPVITAIFPLGLQRGTDAEIRVEGVHLGPTATVKIKAPADSAPGTRLPVAVQSPLGQPLGNPSIVVGEFPEVVRHTSSEILTIPVPGTGNGRIMQPGQTDSWRFLARKGQRLMVEVGARRLGSPLDSTIEILDSKNQPVPRATLRCLAKTYTNFRDHDSQSPGIRIEAWNELAIDDYLYVGGELMRIQALPRHPDDDCRFFSVQGQRVGFLDTTPTHHSVNTPMYKVTIHPPGTTFPPNGLPVITLTYRNDDGGPGYGKDSRLFFDPPADGEYRVRIGDARGQAGSAYAYRLTVRPPQPSYQVRFTPTNPAVWRGNAVPITVTADRMDGFDQAIAVRLENLPPGFSAPATTIPAGEHTTAFALFAEPTAPLPEAASPLKLVARARIGGQDVVREVAGARPQLVEPGDIVTTVDKPEVTVKPGQSVKLKVLIERRNGFQGRVPLDVRGLPHGVRVLDIGLNGILITERDSSRTLEIYCEPWVQPTEHPFVVLARREGKNTEHAARSVLLKVVR